MLYGSTATRRSSPLGIFQAVHHVARAAERGYMLAFCDRKRSGFSFLVRKPAFSAVLYLVQDSREAPDYTSAYQEGDDAGRTFVEEFLRTSAGNMQTSYTRLVAHLAQNMITKFEPWQDGYPVLDQEQCLLWRDRVRAIVSPLVTAPPRCLGALMPEARGVVMAQLVRFAQGTAEKVSI